MTKPPSNIENRRRAALFAQVAARFRDRMILVTTPIYRRGRKLPMEAIGSAVLMQLGGIRFIVSAAHALKSRASETLYAQAAGTIEPIDGPATYLFGRTEPPSRNYPDEIDIRAVRLEGGAWQSMSLHAFLAPEEIVLTAEMPDRHVLTVVGFPESKQRERPKGNAIESFAFPLLGLESTIETYSKVGITPEMIQLLGFDQKKTWTEFGAQTAPHPKGLSGSGMWDFGSRQDFGTRPPRLSAIVTNWDWKKLKYIRGTRLSLIISQLASEYPEIAPLVPRVTDG